MNETVHAFYEKSYRCKGIKAQRHWPNEELARFIGRTYENIDFSDRGGYKILEVGCGSGANLRLLFEEGFGTYGIDLSEEAISLCKQTWGDKICLKTADMTSLPYEDCYFDAVVDVFSSYCLNEDGFNRCISEIKRVLKSDGYYFSYTPSKGADAWKNYSPAEKIDASSLNGIYRESSPYYGNFYTHRFMDEGQVKELTKDGGFELVYLEKVARTYRNEEEYYEFLTYVLKKQ